jgi:isopentenyldiphosphate isomerase
MDLERLTHPELHRLREEALAAGDRRLAEAVAALLAERERAYFTGEMLDIYDDSLRPLGVKERGLVHLEGDWHRSLHCWLVSPARRALLVQRRSRHKPTYPGALDTTVAGHYRSGEGVREACRESQEELGLTVDPRRLVPLGRAVDTARHGCLIDREVADVFLYLTDVRLEDLRPDPAEVAEVLELGVEAALALFLGETQTAPALALAAGSRAARPVAVRAEEFTVHVDRYYARLALQAARLCDGLPPLPI